MAEVCWRRQTAPGAVPLPLVKPTTIDVMPEFSVTLPRSYQVPPKGVVEEPE